MAPLRSLLFTLISLTCLDRLQIAYAERLMVAPCDRQALNLILGIAQAVHVPGVENGKFMSVVGKPEIADVVFGPQNGFVVLGKTEGSTNVVVLDTENGELICTLMLQVGSGRKEILVRIFHGIDKLKESECSRSNCDPLGGVGGTDNEPSASTEAPATTPAPLPAGEKTSLSIRRRNAPIGVVNPGGNRNPY